MALEVGDLVNLKSGGPCMTVVAIEGTNYRCNWFSADTYEMLGGAVHHGTFPEGSLDRWVDISDEEEEETPKKFGS